jgi:hypothetical protein
VRSMGMGAASATMRGCSAGREMRASSVGLAAAVALALAAGGGAAEEPPGDPGLGELDDAEDEPRPAVEPPARPLAVRRVPIVEGARPKIAAELEESGKLYKIAGMIVTAAALVGALVCTVGMATFFSGGFYSYIATLTAGPIGTIELLIGVPLWATGARRMDLARRLSGR